MRRILMLLVLVLTSCRAPGLWPGSTGGTTGLSPVSSRVTMHPITGKVEWPRQIQATTEDIAINSFVSIIDPTTGNSVGAAVTDGSGGFTINPTGLFQATDGQPFYAEVVKGIKGSNTMFNQAGTEAVRLRTIIFFDGATGRWKSLTSSNPADPFWIGTRTTALTVLVVLKQQAAQPVALNSYINAIPNNTSYTPPTGGISTTDFNNVYALVNDAILNDRDPMQHTAYDSASGNAFSTYVGFSISDVQPRTGTINDTITITGAGFDLAPATVSINGVPGTILTLTGDTITAKVGPGSKTGPVSVSQGANGGPLGTVLQAGLVFQVNVSDGHKVFLNGKLYVTNPAWGTVSEVSPNGDVKTVVRGINTPEQVTVGPDNKLYVSGAGDNQIWKIDPASSFASASFAPMTSAWGLAFDGAGNLFASSDQSSGNGFVIKFDSSGSIVTTYSGFTNPRSLGLDYAGHLYVVEAGGTITQLTPGGANGAPRTVMAILTDPRGLAIDSAAGLLVASNANNCIYRVDTTTGKVSVYASINQPSGLSLDASGNLFVSDNGKNLIYRISPSGNLFTYAYGISYPRGIAVDPTDGTLYVSLYKSNALLKVNPSNGILKQFVTGIAPPYGLSFRNDGIYIAQPDTNSASFADRGGVMSTVGTGIAGCGAIDYDSVSGRTFISRYIPPFKTWSDGGVYYGGFDDLLSGTKTSHYSQIHDAIPFIDADLSDNFYFTAYNTLTMIHYLGNSAYKSNVLYTFTNTPYTVAHDAAGNLYVAVPGDNVVHRFLKAGGYAHSTITGLSGPLGLTFVGGAMYVSNSDGKLRRVTNPATDATTDGWTSAAISATAGLGNQGGNIFFTNGGATVWTYNIAGSSVASYSDMPAGVSQVWALPSGEVRAYANYTFTYSISPPAAKVVSAYINETGWGRNSGVGFDEDFNLVSYNTFSYGLAGKYGQMGYVTFANGLAYDQNSVYLAVAGSATGYGCLTRFDLSDGSEYHYVAGGDIYSVCVSAAHNIYAGSTNNNIYLVNPGTGAFGTSLFATTGRPWAMAFYDRGDTLYAVDDNCKISAYSVAGGTTTVGLYGMMEPNF